MRIAVLILALGGLTAAIVGSSPARYRSPIELAFSVDASKLFVVCEGSDELAVLDVASGKVTKRVAVGRVPKGLALSPDGKFVYVANSWSDNVSEIDTSSLAVVRTLPAGFEPNSVQPDREGKFVYAANRISNDISVIDLAAGAETRRLNAGRGAAYLALSPASGALYSTHIYPRIGGLLTMPESEITVVDTTARIVSERMRLPQAAGVFHLAFSADGKLGIAAQLRPKNLIPLAHVAHGWAFGNSITVFGEDVGGEPVQLLLDEIDRYYAIPFAVVISADKKTAYISTSGADSITVLDLDRLLRLVRSASPKERQRLANDLSVAGEFATARIPVGSNPKGMALSPDGRRLYVANRLDDSISVIDTARNTVSGVLSLDGPATDTAERRGERLFMSSRFSFQKQFGCASCHLESTFDGLAWDLEPDGFGKDIVDNRLLEEVADTAPFKWNGGNPDLETECGPRTEKFFYRSQSFSSAQLADLVKYIKSIPRRPNRYRLADGDMTPAQERGKAIFERTKERNGTAIPPEQQCAFCHAGKYSTNQIQMDVGSGKPSDRSPLIDTAHLHNIFLTAPYLHDGSARTLEEIWTIFNPKDRHGRTNDLAKDELNDLIEYLKTL